MASFIILPSGILALLMLQMVYAQDPTITRVKCKSNHQVELRVRYANDLWVKILEPCSTRRQVTTNGQMWLAYPCTLNWDEWYLVTITVDRIAFQDGDKVFTFKCVAQEGSSNVGYSVSAPDFVTDGMITDSVTAEVEMSLTTTAGTPVTQAAVGDTLWLNIFLTDDFKDDYSIHVKEITVRGNGITITLTGETDDGCQSSDVWGVVQKVTDSHMRVEFKAINLLPNRQTPTTQLFNAVVNVCFAPVYNIDDCGLTGCAPEPFAAVGRKRRDVPETNTTTVSTRVDSEEVRASATIIIVSANNGTGNSGNGNDDTAGTSASVQDPVSTPVCEVCLKKSVFYGLIAFFVPALVLAFAASCCLFFRSRKLRKNVEEREIITIRSKDGSVNESFRR